MEKEQKKDKFIDFLKTEYSLTTFYYLPLFGNSFKLCTKLVVLDGILVKSLEEGKIKHDYKDDDLVVLNHMIVLNALSKIMILIECFLSLSDSLLGDYKDVPNKMLRYRQSTVDNFIDKIKKGNLVKNEIWRIFGFPKIEYFSLLNNEKSVVEQVLDHSAYHVITFYQKIAKFYDNHRIPYNKFKHGLSIIPGLKSSLLNDNYSIISTFDKVKNMEEIKGDCISSKKFIPAELEWFNIMSLIPYRDVTFKEYSDILSDLKKLISSITENHLIRGLNLGINYLPKTILTSKSFPEKKFNKLRKIADKKIYSKMYDPKSHAFKFGLNIKDPILGKVKNHFKFNNILNIFMK